MFLLRDLPKYECLRAHASRYPQIDPGASEACLVLLRVASDVLETLTQYLARHDLSQGRFTVLMLLNRDPGQAFSPSDLADRASVTRATMTGLIDGLERDGLVRRDPHPDDRRMFTVRLTPPGGELLDRILPDYFQLVSRLMQGLDDASKRRLVDLLTRLASTASVRPLADPCAPPTVVTRPADSNPLNPRNLVDHG